MKILILMAGHSEAFAAQNYPYPKYILDYKGAPIAQHVVEMVAPLNGELHFVTLQEDNKSAYINSMISILSPTAKQHIIRKRTKGAACSALFAIGSIDNDEELLIINGDQLILHPLSEAVESFRVQQWDGGIVTFPSVFPRWSFVALDEQDLVCETSEKRPISNIATAGCYYFRRGSDFVEAALNIIRKDENWEGNYYVCSTYNELILSQKKVGIFPIKTEEYLSFATPSLYESNRYK